MKAVCASLARCRDFSFRDPLRRAAVSLMANLAEGFGRGTHRECTPFVTVARGSLAEVRSLCYVAPDLGYLGDDKFSELAARCDRIKALITGFIRHLNEAGSAPDRTRHRTP